MNPFNLSGPFGIIPGCPTCNSCDPCKKKDCACPEPVLGIDKVADKLATYRFNLGGKTVTWDFQPGIYEAQTDTTLIVDIVDRLLQFSAERHTDSITAEQLGSILHLNDLGDVSTKGASDGSMLVYKKNDTCPAGCFGTNNVWEPWNALDGQVASASYAAAYDENGNPVSIQQPANPNQYYNLSWNKDKQLSYAQVTEASELRLDTDGYAYQQYIDPNTKEPYYIRIKP